MIAPQLRLTRIVPAPVDEVFLAWTDPAVIARWWGPGDATVTDVSLDVRPGGGYRIAVGLPEGGALVMAGTYVEVSPPSRLSFTWRWEAGGPDDVESRVTVEFRPSGGATELVLTHGGFPDAATAQPYGHGWEATLPNLIALFDGKQRR